MKRVDFKTIKHKVEERTIVEAAKPVMEMALEEGIETAWDRLEIQQPQCGFGQTGVCCNRCTLGPCRIDPFEEGPEKGVCGADADLIVARNFLDDLSTGAAAHSDHGREILETLYKTSVGQAQGYDIQDTKKLNHIAAELGVETKNKDNNEIGKDVALALLEEFGTIKNSIKFIDRAPDKTREIWKAAGISPRSVDREIVESMHRIHMGVGANYANVLLHGLRTSLSDGWGGSMMATEVSDILFGTPEINSSHVNLGTLKKDMVNVILHGHNPILSEMLVKAAQDPEMKKLAREKGASGINLAGICCTGNELLMRKGVPIAGNMLDQELALATGAVEVMVVDYQCIFPSIAQTAGCFHSKIISTSEKSKVSGAVHMELHPETAFDTANKILKLAIENYPNRNQDRVKIPAEPVKMVAGFSVEAIKKALGGSLKPLVDVIASGKIRGAVGIVGCNNPKIKHDYGHIELAKALIKNNILVVETGCAAIASGKAGLLLPEAAELAGEGLKEVCKSLGIPPVLHMGSCVDCSRILVLAAELANILGVGIDQLPLAGAAPEWYSQKAISIGSYFVSSGVFTVLGIPPKIFGSQNVINLVASGLNDVVHAAFAVEPDPVAAAQLICDHIENKRKALNI
ncbi:MULTISPECIES: anaerobic carbon-monoxide dehydrogenase catalytic subunit [Desulfobacula]|uniref:Carbon monoxide dehydrogenase n=2 Tax=Desulfobacula TaxID=28222 RepID=K0NSJ7_DESTT|nr:MULTISPECIES: anaerobic carbon-monoxide dehydrogenase catalytic subunit [Desulfobacula]CCK81967.1 CooS: carbon monoxide dehydrogenase [Desulfobacula toluolica Tol2]SDU43080.1 Ni-dependent carbon monoxide dehydrogenase precursor [Desulfobacula phenolica]